METILKDPLLADVNKTLFIEGLRKNLSNGALPTLYCDVDGVLVDFRSKALRINEKIFEIEKQELQETGKCIKFWEILNKEGPDFWTYLQSLFPIYSLYEIRELMPDTTIKLLTAQPHYDGQDSTVLENFKKGRTEWVKQRLGYLGNPDEFLIMCNRADKKNYAPGNLLIDDYGKNCKEWKRAGGVAIRVTKGPQDILRNSLQAIRLIQTAANKLRGGNT